jgi:hypothetical protein
MIESRLTPTHSHPLKSLLNQPFTGTFHHPRTQRDLLVFKLLIANMAMMALKIGLNLSTGQKSENLTKLIHARLNVE